MINLASTLGTTSLIFLETMELDHLCSPEDLDLFLMNLSEAMDYTFKSLYWDFMSWPSD